MWQTVFFLSTLLRLVKNDQDFVAAENHVYAEPCVDLRLGHSKKFVLDRFSNCL
jgi:hypothetical protein